MAGIIAKKDMDLYNATLVSDEEIELVCDLVYNPSIENVPTYEEEDVQFICTRKVEEDDVFFDVRPNWVAIWSFPHKEKSYFNGYIATTCKHPGITTNYVPVNCPTMYNKSCFSAIDVQHVPDIQYLQKYTGPKRISCIACGQKIDRRKKNKDPPCGCAYPTVYKRCDPLLCVYCGGWGRIDCNTCVMCITNI